MRSISWSPHRSILLVWKQESLTLENEAQFLKKKKKNLIHRDISRTIKANNPIWRMLLDYCSIIWFIDMNWMKVKCELVWHLLPSASPVHFWYTQLIEIHFTFQGNSALGWQIVGVESEVMIGRDKGMGVVERVLISHMKRIKRAK